MEPETDISSATPFTPAQEVELAATTHKENEEQTYVELRFKKTNQLISGPAHVGPYCVQWRHCQFVRTKSPTWAASQFQL